MLFSGTWPGRWYIQYIPRNMHKVFALLYFVVVIHWLIFPYPSGLLHWHCGNLTIAPVPAKQPWWIWINTSCEFIMNDCITTTKQSTTKPCAHFLGYTVHLQHVCCDWDTFPLFVCDFSWYSLALYVPEFSQENINMFCIWVRSRNCGCLVTWFCYQLIAKPGNKTATVSWPDPFLSCLNI